MEVVRVSDKEEAGKLAAAALARLLSSHPGRPLLFLASGGSALSLLNLVPPGALEGKNLTIGVADERYSPDPEVNNFAQLAATPFFQAAAARGAASLDTRVQEGERQDQLAERFQAHLRTWRSVHPDGILIATLGMGPDGHTAGIFPYPETPERFQELFDQQDSWVVGYDATGKHEFPERVTVTLSFLRSLAHGVAFVAGPEKGSAFKRLMAEEGTLAETPARVWREMKEVTVYTDIHGV